MEALRPFRGRPVRSITAGLFAVARADWTLVPSTDPRLEWRGRTVVVPNATVDGLEAVKYDVPGVEVRFSVQGATAVSVIIQQMWSEGPPYEPSGCCCTEEVWNNFIVFVDDVAQVAPDFPPREGTTCAHCTFDTGAYYRSPNPETYDMVSGLDPSVPHDIRLYKDSEADFNHCEPWPNAVTIHGFTIDAGEVVAMPPPPVAPKKIEIIGGSTTCGYCNLCDFASEDGTENILRGSSCDVAWSGIMCKAMAADCHITAWSGMGVAVSLNEKAKIHVPQVFPRAIQSEPDNMWDFNAWQPDMVVIDLGSNDRTVWAEPVFQQQYKDFVHNITGWYGRDIPILAGCGMTDKSYCGQIQDLVDGFKSEGLKVSYLDLDKGNMTDRSMSRRTCCGHPNVEDHGIIAAWVQHEVEAALDHGGEVPDPSAGLSPAVIGAIVAVVCVLVLLLVVGFAKSLCRKRSGPEQPLVESVEMDS